MAADPLTLVIALDRSGAATGELYTDDGRSYAFQRGAYSYRRFAFAASGLLTSAAADAGAAGLPPPLPDFAPPCRIERLVVLGLADGPQGWAATLTAGGQQTPLDAAPGPLYGRQGAPDLALVVRKAGLPLVGDWSIQFSRAAGAGGATS